MDLNQVVTAELQKVFASGEIEKAIEQVLCKTIGEAITESLGRYSEFAKALKEKVAESMKLHGDLDLPSYNDAILKIIRQQVEGCTNAVIQQQVADRMRELLEPAPDSITLTRLVEEYIEHVKHKASYGCVCHGDEEISLTVEETDHDYKYIGLAEDANKKRRECDIEIGVNKEGEIWNIRFRNQSIERETFAGPFYGFERMVFQMRVAGTKIIFDADPSDIETRYSLVEV